MANASGASLLCFQNLFSDGTLDLLAIAIDSIVCVTEAGGKYGLSACLLALRAPAPAKHLRRLASRTSAVARAVKAAARTDVADQEEAKEPKHVVRGPDTLAVDCEAPRLARDGGRIAVLQLKASHHPTTFLLCLRSIQADIRIRYGKPIAVWDWVPPDKPATLSLRQLLASTTTRKLLIDCRKDAESLFHNDGIKLSNVYDLQVGHTLCSYLQTGHHAASVKPAHVIVGSVLPPKKAAAYHRLQQAGKKFHDATPNAAQHWNDTPLPDALRLYAASDVAFLDDVYRHQRRIIANSVSHHHHSILTLHAFVVKTTNARLKLAHTGDAELTYEQMWKDETLIHLVNPCFATEAPDTTVVAKTLGDHMQHLHHMATLT